METNGAKYCWKSEREDKIRGIEGSEFNEI